MDAGGGGDARRRLLARQCLAAQLVAGVLGRPLAAVEDAVSRVGGRAALPRAGRPFTLRDLCAEIARPARRAVADVPP